MLEILTLGANHLTLILEHMTCCMQMVSSLLKKRGMNFALSHFRLFFLWMQTSFYTPVHTNFSPNVICVRQRCDFSTIMLEMDRMLRPDGRVYIRDTISVIGEVNEIASALGWVPSLRETGEGPHSSWRILICDKRM